MKFSPAPILPSRPETQLLLSFKFGIVIGVRVKVNNMSEYAKLCQKGVFPYAYIDLDQTTTTPEWMKRVYKIHKACYDSLKDELIPSTPKRKGPTRFLRLETPRVLILEDYSDIYLSGDVFLLAHIFQKNIKYASSIHFETYPLFYGSKS